MGSMCTPLEERRGLFGFYFVTKFGEDFDSPVMDFMSSQYVSLE